MMKINKIDPTRLQNETYFQFQTEFNDLVTRTGAEVLKIQSQFTVYLPLYGTVDNAFKKIIKSHLTKQLQDKDKARDEIWYGLVDVIKSALRHFDPQVQLSAQKLKIVVDTYGNIAKKNLNAQTAAIYNIMQDFTGKYSADVARVGLVPWITELQNRNSEFDALMKDRFDETAARNDTVLREARGELDTAYFTIVERINALIIVEGEADYEVFVRTWNAVIAKYNMIIKGKRRNNADSSDGGDSQDDGTDEQGQQEQDI